MDGGGTGKCGVSGLDALNEVRGILGACSGKGNVGGGEAMVDLGTESEGRDGIFFGGKRMLSDSDLAAGVGGIGMPPACCMLLAGGGVIPCPIAPG